MVPIIDAGITDPIFAGPIVNTVSARIGRLATLGTRSFGVREACFDEYLDEIREEGERALRKCNLLVVPGAEVTQDNINGKGKNNAHIIALDIKRYISADRPALEILREIRRRDALSIA